ncbi:MULTISPECIES: ATP synthase subunit I [Limnobacter]|nr:MULTISPECIES: ATP synthase subunit I [Limnobacter]HEX5485470.1 ATP synthase subunit I [Limnobacter sp.]
MWKIVGLQWVAGSLVCLLLLLVSREHATSAAWGVTSVAVPSTLFAARLSLGSRNAMSGVFVFLIGEFLKVIASVAILFVAYRLDPSLIWWSVVLACAVTLKSYFLAFFLR